MQNSVKFCLIRLCMKPSKGIISLRPSTRMILWCFLGFQLKCSFPALHCCRQRPAPPLYSALHSIIWCRNKRSVICSNVLTSNLARKTIRFRIIQAYAPLGFDGDRTLMHAVNVVRCWGKMSVAKSATCIFTRPIFTRIRVSSTNATMDKEGESLVSHDRALKALSSGNETDLEKAFSVQASKIGLTHSLSVSNWIFTNVRPISRSSSATSRLHCPWSETCRPRLSYFWSHYTRR